MTHNSVPLWTKLSAKGSFLGSFVHPLAGGSPHAKTGPWGTTKPWPELQCERGTRKARIAWSPSVTQWIMEHDIRNEWCIVMVTNSNKKMKERKWSQINSFKLKLLESFLHLFPCSILVKANATLPVCEFSWTPLFFGFPRHLNNPPILLALPSYPHFDHFPASPTANLLVHIRINCLLPGLASLLLGLPPPTYSMQAAKWYY